MPCWFCHGHHAQQSERQISHLAKVFMNFTRYSYVDFVTLTAQGTGTSECAVVQSNLILVMRV